MTKIIPFIGREQELDQIDTWINEQGTYRVVCIDGEGGIGKTRLLQEIHRRYGRDQAEIFVTRILDFDDRTLQTPISLGLAMSQVLIRPDEEIEDKFKSYLEMLHFYQQLTASASTPKSLIKEIRGKMLDAWYQDFNQITLNSRVIYLFDTSEKIKNNKEVTDYLKQNLLSKKANNALFIIAGRNADDLFHDFYPLLEDSTQLISLQPFDNNSAYTFMQEATFDFLEDQDLAQKIIFLADGRPILLGLATDLLERQYDLNWLKDISLDDLQNLSLESLEKYKNHFKQNLVKEIGENRTNLDILIQTLSRIYPANSELIETVLEISEHDAEVLFQNAKEYIFMKILPDGTISLHDEVRALIQELVWPSNDPTTERRQAESRLAAKYYSEQVKMLEDKLKKHDLSLHASQYITDKLNLTIENWVEHALYADVNNNFKIYLQYVTEARRTNKIILAKRLQDLASNYSETLSEENLYALYYWQSWLLYDEEKTTQAKEGFQNLLEKYGTDIQRRADIFSGISASEVKLGNFETALVNQKESLNLSIQLNKISDAAQRANSLGYIHRLRGEWNVAIEYYERAFDLALESPDTDGKDLGLILNNWGYALGLEGKYEKAQDYCKQAIAHWESLKLTKDVARGETTLASIYRDQGKYDKAIELVNTALTRLEDTPFDGQSLSRAYFTLGWTQWFKGASEEYRGNIDLELINAAHLSFEKSLTLARKYHINIVLPGILHQMSNVLWLLGEKEKARQYNQESYMLSKRMHDIRYAIDSLVGFAEYDYKDGEYAKIPTYAQKLWDDYESKGYPFNLFYGRMRRILADVAFEQGNYDTALGLYAKGIKQIASHGGWGMYFIDREKFALTKRIESLPDLNIAHKWIVHLKEYWTKHNVEEMISWCNQCLSRIKVGGFKQ